MKNRKEKQQVSKVLSNNWKLLKLCFSAAPCFCIVYIIEAIRNELVIFFEFTLGLTFVLESAEYGRPFNKVFIVMLCLFLFVVLGLLMNACLYQRIMLKGKAKIRQKMKHQLYEKAKEIDLECYDNPSFYNDFIMAIAESDKQIDRLFELLTQICTAVTAFITTGAFYLANDAVSVIFIIASFLFSFFLTKAIIRINYKQEVEKKPAERETGYVNRVFYLNDYAKETRLNPEIPDILFDQMNESYEKIYQINKNYAKKYMKMEFIRDYICNDFISDVLYITYLVYKAAVLHSISYSLVVVLFNSSGRIKDRLRMLTRIYPNAEAISLYMNKINQFLSMEPKVKNEKRIPVPTEPKILELKNVSFSYTEESPNVLNHINMVIHPYERVAIVGYNGAGKTTLIKLIMRLYDPKDGEILLDGINIKDYDLNEYREYIGAVFQDFKLYAATIKENVKLDLCENVNEEHIRQALVKSDFKERLDTLTKGIDTNLTTEFEKDGVNLSGGESQKIAISRVFYKKCGMVILDEPSSALDPIAEYNLNHSMLDAGLNKTVIFISHRLSTTRLADRIYMFENGQIIENGTHEALLKNNFKYAQMWKVQASVYGEN